ncbi:MAG: hypothetical protein ACFBSG_01065, partial [Leptolyngbyaceae cyanobacterium]
GDSDYTPFVVRLIASGARVFGFGRVKTASIAFREACTEFVSLDGDVPKSPVFSQLSSGTVRRTTAATPSSIDSVALTVVDSLGGLEEVPIKIFTDAITQNQQAKGWAEFKSIGAYLSQRKIVKAAYNVNRWADFYKKYPAMFEVRELEGKTMVRLLPEPTLSQP